MSFFCNALIGGFGRWGMALKYKAKIQRLNSYYALITFKQESSLASHKE